MDSMAKEYNVNLQILKFWYGQLHGTGSMQSMVFIAKDEKRTTSTIMSDTNIPLELLYIWKSMTLFNKLKMPMESNHLKNLQQRLKFSKVFMTDEIIFPRVCVLPGRKNITNELKSFVYHLRNSLSVLRVASKQTIFTSVKGCRQAHSQDSTLIQRTCLSLDCFSKK
ncbi:uncharacterized protein LOC109833982 [Asparagus officinalis]|uniref:uncharacterized protein LOC109833982 n=1 Tax=Asparagus officinalis TaxID=4686 RepID=UPI00098DF5D9|nr:uncharacterized protein LOC109833982 [Asparagus officinalis]XP_020257458.1 uncharacterized protein LOC109833982 [Asparagus officinalis]